MKFKRTIGKALMIKYAYFKSNKKIYDCFLPNLADILDILYVDYLDGNYMFRVAEFIK